MEVEADLVVLATGVEASAGARELAEKLRISYDMHGFYDETVIVISAEHQIVIPVCFRRE